MHGQTEGPMLWLCLIVTLAFVVGEAFAGFVSNSLALLSDAGHNFSDAFALGLAAYAVWIARKPSNAGKTYGYHRASILTALFNAATGDALSAVGVLAAGWVVKSTGWTYADPAVSVLIAGFIAWSSIGVARDATNVLLEGSPKGLDVEKMIDAMREVGHVQAVHDVHVWTVSDHLNFLSAHVEVANARTMEECGAVIRDVNEVLFHRFGIGHATIQVESAGACGEESRLDPLHCDDIHARKTGA